MCVHFSNYNKLEGFAASGYDTSASLPTEICWSRQSRFAVPLNPQILCKTRINNCSHDSPTFCVDRDRNALIDIHDPPFSNESWGKIIKISRAGHIDELFQAKHRLYNLTLIQNGNILCILHYAATSKLTCLLPDGKILWEFLFKGNTRMRPVLDEGGNIYLFTFFNEVGTLLCLRPDGVLRWKRDFPSMCWHEPVISKNGLIYLGLNKERCLCALDSDGNLLWSKTVGLAYRDPFLIKNDGTLYIVLSDLSNPFNNSLSTISSSGEVIWQYRTDGNCNISSGPALDNSGNLYFNTTQFELVSVNSDGELRWKSKTSGVASAPPIIGANGIVFQQCWLDTPREYTSYLEAYYAGTGEKLWFQSFKGFINSAVLAEDNTLYLLTSMKMRSRQTQNRFCEFYVIGNNK